MASDTKPRGPIAAMYNSPGPASYQLRPTIGAVEHSKSSTHRQMPSYSIAGRPKGGDTDKSPGPCYNLPPGYNHKGASGIPSYSLAPRAKDLSMDSIPGPDKYDDSPCTDKVKRKAPAYSFGLKTDAHSKNNNPAPNHYTCPTTIGGGPKPLVTSRTKDDDGDNKGPGPAKYNADVKSGAPAYSITGRNGLPGDNTQKPGPGTYNPGDIDKSKQRAPAYTFGRLHSPYIGGPIMDDPRFEEELQ